MLHALRDGDDDEQRSPMVISGNIGPRGDGYDPDQLMSAREARGLSRLAGRRLPRRRRRSRHRLHHDLCRRGDRHRARGRRPRHAVRDLVHASRPTAGCRRGETLARGDRARSMRATGDAPAYYMINCAHPDAFRRDRSRTGERLDAAHPRPARQCLDAQPCRARQFAPSSTSAIRVDLGAATATLLRPLAALQRPRRLLRHRSPPRRVHLGVLPRPFA